MLWSEQATQENIHFSRRITLKGKLVFRKHCRPLVEPEPRAVQAAQKLIIYRAEQLCLVTDGVTGAGLHVPSCG